MEDGLPKPDLVVLLDIPPGLSRRRKSKGRDVHEGDLAYLTRVRREYLHLARKFRWKIVDGHLDPEVVRNLVWAKVTPKLHG